jgi:hypothetical protein
MAITAKAIAFIFCIMFILASCPVVVVSLRKDRACPRSIYRFHCCRHENATFALMPLYYTLFSVFVLSLVDSSPHRGSHRITQVLSRLSQRHFPRCPRRQVTDALRVTTKFFVLLLALTPIFHEMEQS